MTRIVPLRTSARGTLYVEMEELHLQSIGSEKSPSSIPDQPEGSELTSAMEEALDAMDSLKAGLKDLVESIKDGIGASAPTAWKLEVNIGFKGRTSPIPIVLSGEAGAAFKLQIEWKS